MDAAFFAADLTPTVRTTCRAGAALRALGRDGFDEPPRDDGGDPTRAGADLPREGAADPVRRAGAFATGAAPALPWRGDARRSSAGAASALTRRAGGAAPIFIRTGLSPQSSSRW